MVIISLTYLIIWKIIYSKSLETHVQCTFGISTFNVSNKKLICLDNKEILEDISFLTRIMLAIKFYTDRRKKKKNLEKQVKT